jgi:hypothetical protein
MNHTQPYIDSITESRRSRDRRTFSDLFGEMPTVIVGQEIGPEHAVLLDAYRRAHGLAPWIHVTAGTELTLTATEVNQAIDWWNDWQAGRAAA